MAQDTRLENTYRIVARQIVDAIYPEADDERKGRSMRIIVHQLKEALVPMLSDIREFHEKFGLAYDGPPRVLPKELREFRLRFIHEELDEYCAAVRGLNSLDKATEQEQLEAELDALVDLLYLTLGTAYLQGFLPIFAEAWKRVHQANMSKVRALSEKDSKRGSTYDIVKPPGWKAPDHSDLVKAKGEA